MSNVNIIIESSKFEFSARVVFTGKFPPLTMGRICLQATCVKGIVCLARSRCPEVAQGFPIDPPLGTRPCRSTIAYCLQLMP